MFEHQDCDTDEDCEVYFLKPVNEYNIVDKIKEANKELFALNSTEEQDEEPVNMNKKVTFAPNLEDYETNCSGSQLHSNESNSNEAIDAMHKKLSPDYKFPPIDEEPNLFDATDNEDDEVSILLTSTSATEINSIRDIKIGIPDTTTDLPHSSDEQDDVVEEICEEIIDMDMDTERRLSKDITSSTSMRRILKQATFDYDEDQFDNKTFNNNIVSDVDNEINSESENQLRSPTSPTYKDDDDDDEDDQLSILVASYLPDDFDNTSFYSNSDKEYTEQLDKNVTKKSQKTFFNKRLSTRQKANSIGTCTNSNKSQDITDLKLHYKTCCEYRHSAQVKLPKYTGYLSEYGLSREQLENRDQKNQRKQRFILEQTLKTTEHEMRKMKDNERAFTTWLKNKLRFPINKTRNMFDVKKVGADNSNTRNHSTKSKKRP